MDLFCYWKAVASKNNAQKYISLPDITSHAALAVRPDVLKFYV